MLYLIAIVLSFTAGLATGLLVFRRHAERLKAAESEGRKLLDALKNSPRG
jgi:hypothetical protein